MIWSGTAVDVDGRKYRGSFCRFIRYQQNDRRLNVGITEYSLMTAADVAAKTESDTAESAVAQVPLNFTKVELFWTQQGSDSIHHRRIDDSEVRTYEPFACVKRMNKSVNVMDLTGVPVMSSIVCDRLRVVAKYRSHVFRLSRSAQNSQNQRRRARHLAAAVGSGGELKREEDAPIPPPPPIADGHKRYRTIGYDTVKIVTYEYIGM